MNRRDSRPYDIGDSEVRGVRVDFNAPNCPNSSYLFMRRWDFIFLVTMLLPDVTVMINGVPGTRLCWRACGRLPRWMAEEPGRVGDHVDGFLAGWQGATVVPPLRHQSLLILPSPCSFSPLSENCNTSWFDCSSPAVQSLCLTILYPFSQEQFTLVTKLLIHSINFLLHLFLISLSDFFAQLRHFTICPGQPAPTKRSFHFRSKSSKCFLTEQSHLKGKLYCDKGIRLVFHICQLIYILK